MMPNIYKGDCDRVIIINVQLEDSISKCYGGGFIQKSDTVNVSCFSGIQYCKPFLFSIIARYTYTTSRERGVRKSDCFELN